MRECLALSWDEALSVYGARVRLVGKGRLSVTGIARLDAGRDGEDGFSERLRQACSELGADSGCAVAGGFLPGAVCFETFITKLGAVETRQALSFELPRAIPFPVEDLAWNYRIVGDGETHGKPGFSIARVFAAPEREWSRLISALDAAGIKADAVVFPFMAVGEGSDEKGFCLEGIDGEFSFCGGFENSLLEMRHCEKTELSEDFFSGFDGLDKLIDNDSELREKLAPCLLLATYALSGNFSRDAQLELPEKLRPQRFKFLKLAAAVLIATAILSGVGFAGRKLWSAHHRLGMVKRAQSEINKRIEKIKAANKKSLALDELIGKISEASSGNADLLMCLHYLSKKLPASMWVTNFSVRGDKIDVTIKSFGKAEDLLAHLRGSPFFSTDNIRKRRNSDGSVYVYLKLVRGTVKDDKKDKKRRQS